MLRLTLLLSIFFLALLSAPTLGLADTASSATSAISASSASSAANVSDKAVAESVARGVAYLKTLQNADGSFLGRYRIADPFGETALALLAMRYAGVSPNDPAFVKGRDLLLANESERTYVNSLIAQVLAASTSPAHPSSSIRERMSKLSEWLTSAQLKNGAWTYSWTPNNDLGKFHFMNFDNSNTQFAVLALWKLAEAGVAVDQRHLRTCEEYYLKTQNSDGGWSYVPSFTTSRLKILGLRDSCSLPSMTVTGLASMHIFADLLHLHDEGSIFAGQADMCGKTGPLDRGIDNAMARAETDLNTFLQTSALPPAPNRPPPLTLYTAYYLYSVQRVGAASGKKSFGAIDWYPALAQLALATQNANGSWGDHSEVTTAGEFPPPAPGKPKLRFATNDIETSFALLFLAKGSSPVFFEKLRYDGDWSNDRLDVAHVTDYAGRELEKHFNWEVIDVKSDVAGWFDGPVLFLNGHDGPKFSDDEKKKLKDYVDRGGFLFTEACCGRPKFAAAIRKLAHELWPDLDWKTLPADHPLFTQKSHFDLKKPTPLEGLTDAKGFTFFILSPHDVSCLWNQNLISGHESDFLLALNVYDYARHGQSVRSRPSQ